ncbi:very short patch repair endonuclease [Xanthomonas sp. WHRI 7945]|nr:very short patch repair endonuclease [Xanthomonas campestris pv. campestris]
MSTTSNGPMAPIGGALGMLAGDMINLASLVDFTPYRMFYCSMDFMSKEARSYLMSRIRGRDTKPEMIVRRYLHSRGLRYSLHDRRLPGRPDLVFRSRKVAIFVHGCFWHGHEGCHAWKMPKTRTDYWTDKITGNRRRDARAIRSLRKDGWLVCVIWACQLNDRRLERLYKKISGRNKL